MSDKRKTFRVRCPHCEQPFTVRFGEQDAKPESSGKAVVIVDCLHCGKPSTIEIPRTFVQKDVLIRGVATDRQPDAQRLDGDEAAG